MSKTLDNSHIGTLVTRVQNGETGVWVEVIEVTQAPLFKFCLLLSHNREVAEDLCQETFIKALQNIHKLKNPITLVGWMYQIAKNLFIDQKRSSAQEFTSKENSQAESAYLLNMDEILGVQNVLAQFEPEERFLLFLIELDGFSYKEAADLAGLSEDAVRSKLHRLRQQFMQRIESLQKKAG